MHRKLTTPAIIILLAAIGWILWQRDLPMRDSAVLGIGLGAVGLFGLAALSDLIYHRVDNRVQLGLLLLYFPWFLLTLPGYEPAILAVFTLIIGILSSPVTKLGGGLVKLFALAFLWSGTANLVTFAVLYCFLIGVVCIVWSLSRKFPPVVLAVIAMDAAFILIVELDPLTGWIMPVR